MTTPDERKTKALDTRGLLNEDGYGRKLRSRRCHRCGQPIVAGLDADRMALAVDCYPELLTHRGEVGIVLAGGITYRLWGRSIGAPFPEWRIDYRGTEDIAAHSADDVDVLGSHHCMLRMQSDWSRHFVVPADSDPGEYSSPNF